MLHRKYAHRLNTFSRSIHRVQSDAGFSIVELLVVISLVGIIFVTFSSFFNNYLIAYSQYQKDNLNATELSAQSQRVSQVLRGLTDIVSESANDVTVYAYFAPIDTYVSLVHYYLNASNTALLVDVTPMTANPPNGTPLAANIKTYTIIANYFQAPGVSLFNYFDASGTAMSLPISDEHSIMEIQVNLAEPGSHTKVGQNLSVIVSLRNRKTNL